MQVNNRYSHNVKRLVELQEVPILGAVGATFSALVLGVMLVARAIFQGIGALISRNPEKMDHFKKAMKEEGTLLAHSCLNLLTLGFYMPLRDPYGLIKGRVRAFCFAHAKVAPMPQTEGKESSPRTRANSSNYQGKQDDSLRPHSAPPVMQRAPEDSFLARGKALQRSSSLDGLLNRQSRIYV